VEVAADVAVAVAVADDVWLDEASGPAGWPNGELQAAASCSVAAIASSGLRPVTVESPA
jgi:hypothetical protein